MQWFEILLVGMILITFAVGLTGLVFGELQCIDFSKKLYQHIHIILTVDGKSAPGGIGLEKGCFGEMHTHFADNWVHLESNEPRNFTLGEFFELWGLGLKDRTVSINGELASFNQTLKNMDKVVVVSQR